MGSTWGHTVVAQGGQQRGAVHDRRRQRGMTDRQTDDLSII